MLRSYQYIEKSYMDCSLRSDLFHDKEIEIARKFTQMHPICRKMQHTCSICGKESGRYFYTKWGVDYLCCEACKSVYAVYEEETVAEYLKYEELQSLRFSKEYQEQITKNRKEVWQDFLEWMEVRAFRFMKRNHHLSIVDIGNRFKGYSEILQQSAIAGNYDLRESLLARDTYQIPDGGADIVFWLDQMKSAIEPEKKLSQFANLLKPDGLLVLSTRAGSGFDIITLQENNREIYPYEHILLPSVNGLTRMLQRCGYEVLEVTTPGVMDLKYVMESKDKLDGRESFVRTLLEESDRGVLQEFQRFLQKSCLSSFVCVIARKEKNYADI